MIYNTLIRFQTYSSIASVAERFINHQIEIIGD